MHLLGIAIISVSHGEFTTYQVHYPALALGALGHRPNCTLKKKYCRKGRGLYPALLLEKWMYPLLPLTEITIIKPDMGS